MHNPRRHFLRRTAALSAAVPGALAGVAGGLFTSPLASPFARSLAGIATLSAQQATAANTAGPYRALVCLFMAGGNDSHNWVVPTDPSSHAEYRAARGNLAWPASKLLPITCTTQAAGRSFGMATELQPLRDWYEAGQLAVVANVGPLERPTTLADFQASRNLPSKLFSHNDQASTWQSLSPEGAPSGWGGRMADLLMSANDNPVFTSISTSGNAVFLSGQQVTQYQVGSDGPVGVAALNEGMLFESSTAPAVLRRTLLRAAGNTSQSEYARVMQRSLDTSARLQAALANTAVPGLPSTPLLLNSPVGNLALDKDPLARQLRMVARLIAAAPQLGLRRQVFMVSIGGFDSHVNQLAEQPLLMARVAHSANWFMQAMHGIGMLNNVTLFTASDFGRALTSNGSGCDHGWGSHHLVAGGAVKGRNIHGRFPVTALGTADDVGSGRLLPSSSVTEYAATLGRWMGLSNTELSDVLPNWPNFSNTGLPFV